MDLDVIEIKQAMEKLLNSARAKKRMAVLRAIGGVLAALALAMAWSLLLGVL